MAQYTIKVIKELADRAGDGTYELFDDQFLKQWRLIIELEPTRYWFLSVIVRYSGEVKSFSLDYEDANDSHYIFTDEEGVRGLLYKEGDEDLCLHEIILRYMKRHRGNGDKLLTLLRPYIVDECHFSGFGD